MESWLTSWLERDSVKTSLVAQAILPASFYERTTLDVAQELLGKILVVRGGGVTAGRIVETEAYTGTDPASHSSRGETPRCSIMFGKPGVAYVYFIYGMYEMLNFVTEPQGTPGAVLIRAVEPIFGIDLMKIRRKKSPEAELTRGPGKLCRAMGIQMEHNGKSLQGPELLVIDDGFRFRNFSVSPRVGISKAQDLLWRFFITDNPWVSRVPQNKESIQRKEVR